MSSGRDVCVNGDGGRASGNLIPSRNSGRNIGDVALHSKKNNSSEQRALYV